jgi:electron transport complex protein RnfD
MSDEKKLYQISVSPHVRAEHTTAFIMKEVVFSLLPVLIFSTLYFGVRVLLIVGLSILSAVLSEYLWQRLTKQTVTIQDWSAVVTGLLLAFNMPISIPWWIPVIGSAFAIIVVKQVFGGLGQNFMNPALAARCFLLISWTSAMTNFSTTDAVSVATPLAQLQSGATSSLPSIIDCLLGTISGCIGETSALLLMAGGIYLIARKIIDYRIPVAYIGTVILFTYLLGGNGIYHALTGGLMLGAFYMATDYVTSPMNKGGKWIMGIGCGIITVLIRQFGGYPEGVSFSILLMNVCVPLIDRFTKPHVYGVTAPKKEKKAKKEGEDR